jgi:hypothetical protein
MSAHKDWRPRRSIQALQLSTGGKIIPVRHCLALRWIVKGETALHHNSMIEITQNRNGYKECRETSTDHDKNTYK